MRRYILLLIGLLFLAACEKEDTLSHPNLCDDEYFYYSDSSRINLRHSLNKVWIEFEQRICYEIN